MAWLDAANVSDLVTYKPVVGEVAGSSPTLCSVLYLLLFCRPSFFILRQAAFVNVIISQYEISRVSSLGREGDTPTRWPT